MLVEAELGMVMVGEAADGAIAVALARETHPDVVLVDIRMPVVDGLRATRGIAADPDLAGVHVLILTTSTTTSTSSRHWAQAPPVS